MHTSTSPAAVPEEGSRDKWSSSAPSSRVTPPDETAQLESLEQEAVELLLRIMRNSEKLHAGISGITSASTLHEIREGLQSSRVTGCDSSSQSGSASGGTSSSGHSQDWHAAGAGADGRLHRRMVGYSAGYDCVQSSTAMPHREHAGAESASRLRGMSTGEITDALERADMSTRVRKWVKQHGSGAVAKKLHELEARAHILAKQTAHHQRIVADESAPPHLRALSKTELEVNLRGKQERVLRQVALLEEHQQKFQ
jgi:hypothetical protein